MQHHRHATAGDLPRRLAARETAADDMNGLHWVWISKRGGGVNHAVPWHKRKSGVVDETNAVGADHIF